MINQHTPGPLRYAGFIGEGKCNGTHSVDPRGRCVLDNPQPDGMPAAEGEANAKLSVAAFNQFDRAARALGVDATELAEKIDLLHLIQEWASFNKQHPMTALIVQRGVTKQLHQHAQTSR